MSQAVADKAFSVKVSKVVDEIATWTILDLKEFKEAYETRFGVTAAAPVAVAAAGGAAAGGAAAAPAEEKTAFDIVLENGGANKIAVIKVVRQYTSLGLKEAKDLVEGAPKTVRGATKDEADKIEESRPPARKCR